MPKGCFNGIYLIYCWKDGLVSLSFVIERLQGFINHHLGEVANIGTVPCKSFFFLLLDFTRLRCPLIAISHSVSKEMQVVAVQ